MSATNIEPDSAKAGPAFVSVEQYGLPKNSAKLKLTPLDMNVPRLYGARWILCFPLSGDADREQVYEYLRLGLAHTIAAIPWIAGEVGPEEGSDPDTSRIQVVDGSGSVQFKATDLGQTLPSYEELKAQHFPLSKLPTEHLSPVAAMPLRPPYPVFAAQANFIQGGLLLTVVAHHSVCDGSGTDTIIDTWAKNTAAAADGSAFIAPDPSVHDRNGLMSGTSGAEAADFPEYVLMPTPKPAAPVDMSAFKLPPMTSHIFHFSRESLATLKGAAAAHSTNDALLAFLWTHMIRARNPPAETTSMLCLAADIRPRTDPPLPASYLGNASVPVVTKRFSAPALAAESGLKEAAAAIRASIAAVDARRVARSVGLIASRADPTDYKYTFNYFLGPDVVSTSWTRFGVYDRSWGALGKPDSFRIPGEGADGVVIVLPALRDGGLEVVAGLEDGAMGRLLEDKEFLETATLWG